MVFVPRVGCFALLMHITVISGVSLNVTSADRWSPVRQALESWSAISFDTSFAVNIGDDTGPLFEWATPGFSIDQTLMEGASLSKVRSHGLVAVRDRLLSVDH